tara:strand:+ start:1181 stop:1516 length:336 start_codon:yes stop_codon:yes gene_type:complete
MATIQEKQLAQAAGVASAASIYSPGSGETAVIKNVTIANVTAGVSTYSLHLDDNGASYTDATALFKAIPIAAGETHILSVYWPMNNASGNLSAGCAVNNDCTVTVFGLLIT